MGCSVFSCTKVRGPWVRRTLSWTWITFKTRAGQEFYRFFLVRVIQGFLQVCVSRVGSRPPRLCRGDGYRYARTVCNRESSTSEEVSWTYRSWVSIRRRRRYYYARREWGKWGFLARGFSKQFFMFFRLFSYPCESP